MDRSMIAAGLSIAAGIASLLMAVGRRRLHRASQAWPATSGTFLGVSFEPRRYGDPFIRIDARYEYFVEGRRYEGSRLRLGGVQEQDRLAAEGMVAQLRAAPSIQVYYDPRRPERALLDRSEPPPGFAYGIAWSVMMLLAGLLLLSR